MGKTSKRPKPKKSPGIQYAIRKTGPVYRARVFLTGNPKPVFGSWRSDIQQAIDDRKAMIDRTITAPAKMLRLSEAMARVLEKCDAKGRRAATREWYRLRFLTIADGFPTDPPLHQLDAPAIEAWARRRFESDSVKSWSTVFSDLRALGRCFTLGGLPSPIKAVREDLPDGDDPEPGWFHPKELRQVLAKIRKTKLPPHACPTERDANVIEFLACTGLRLREAADLTVADVKLAKKQILVRGGKRGTDTVSIAQPEIIAIVCEFLGGRERFPANRTEPLLPVTYAGIKQLFQRWADRLDEPRLTPHSMRRTFATTLALHGASDRQIKAAMRLKSIAMVTTYVKLSGADAAPVVDAVSFRSA